MCSVGREEAGEAKICDFHIEIFIDQDVVGFDVTMDDIGRVEVGDC